jgi:hypothetical protein
MATVTYNAIDNMADVIDSRDVIGRIEELQEERAELAFLIEDIEEDKLQDAISDLEQWDEENGDELRSLKALAEEAEGYAADWKYGEALIRDSYFKEYAMQLAEDIGAINGDATWPNNCIDWDQAAKELRMDYTAVEFDGLTYWIR